MMSVSPATASECQAAGTKPVRHARYRHCEERGEETNPDATPGSPRAPAHPRDGAWRFGAAASCAGAGLAGGQFIPGRRRLHLRGRADPPTRCADQAPKLKFPVLGGQASVWAAAVAFAVLGTGCAPDATAPGETGIVRPGNSHRDRLARKLPPARPSRRRRKAPQSSR
jgi:hypothetical protein